MTGAMYAAIAGLKTHMSDLNVIGNNIANVNTYGYKYQRSIFSDSIYTMYSSGSNGTTTVGGTNPSQVGYGTTLSSIDTNISATGTYAVTGNGLDCMIMGDGFFLVGDKTVASAIDATDPQSLKSLTLTRVGNFEFKADGYLSDSSGSVVYGFMCIGVVEGEPVFSDQLVPIRYPRMQVVTDEAGKQTVQIAYPTYDLAGNLIDSAADDDGFVPMGTAGSSELPYVSVDSVTIDKETGLITAITKDTNQVITIGALAIGNVTNPNGLTHEDGPYYKCAEGAGDLGIALLGGLANDMYVSAGHEAIDFAEEGLTLESEDFTKLTHVNKSQLEDPENAPDGNAVLSGGTTSLRTGGLEGSSTDLATEITRMITTQRGYQANTRIITVTDTMLEELVNMKR